MQVPDVIAHGLRVLLVGINPSLYSAAVGHHFARPGNRFFPALQAAGITNRLLSPDEDQQLVESGFGITNIVAFATARADELSTDDLVNGACQLASNVQEYQPACVCFLGITAYRTAFGRKHAVVGRQPEIFCESIVWVLPNPSGLNAHYQLPKLATLFRQMVDDVGAG